MRRPDLAALHLSKPNAPNEQTFMATNQTMQNRSNVFRRAKVYHEHFGFGAKNSWLYTLHRAFKLAASPGFAPAFARSYGGQARSSGSRDRRAPDYTTRHLSAECAVRSVERGSCLPSVNSALRTQQSAFEVVAREGSAPPISGCRPDVMLFHHRAVEVRRPKIGCRGWIRTNMAAFKGRCPTN